MDLSEPKLIEPLLKDHIMGAPISQHHGVCCCPALLKNTDEKYIVKIISIPASPNQLDALLLTGACRNEEEAQAYFRRQAEEVVAEATLLKRLAQVEGFHSYNGWQIEPMEDGIGCDVYLLGEYCDTLSQHLTTQPLSHLSAVNLGLDLCSALSLSRRNGQLYVDLRPENVIITANREFRIADLGFVSLESLKYIALPEKYRSAYTAPEIADEYACLNTTLDIYAAGLILYQVFNGGKLPEGDEIEPPFYADYDMAQIILKACAADPQQRWQDPQQMGQALITYLQSHSVNDTPIIPVIVTEPENTQEAEEIPQETDTAPAEDTSAAEAPAEETLQQDEGDSPASEEPEEEEQFVIDGFLFDDDQLEPEAEPFSEEMDEMLAQADDLIAHQTPDPVIAPEPVDIPIPDPIIPEPEEAPEAEVEEIPIPSDDPAEESQPEEPQEQPITPPVPQLEPPEPPQPISRKKLTGLITTLVVVLLVILLAAGGFYYHQNIYLQTIDDVTADVFEDQAVITVDTKADESLLTVICTDIYGNSRQQALENGTAVFDDLNAGTTYKITLSVSGYHKLTGTTSTSFTTATQTNILSFTAIAGDTDGSVILNFSVQGPDSKNWSVHYMAPREHEKEVSCSGHMATITGLTVGARYTFWLVPEEELYVIGSDSIVYIAQPVVYAQDLAIQGYQDGNLIVTWSAPEGIDVESWTVRCYNNDGFDYTTTVTDTHIAIEGLDPTVSYTVDVKAAGMSVSKWTSITANSVTFKDISVTNIVDGQPGDTLYIQWDYEGVAPAEGWQLSYTVNGGERQVITTTDPNATIYPVIPGAEYSFSFVMPEGITAYGGTAQYTAPYSQFDHLGITAQAFTFRMCWTPEEENWRWYYLWEQDFTNTFALGESASFVVHVDGDIAESDAQFTTLFIIRNADGTIVRTDPGKTLSWSSMWDKNYTELDMPAMPDAAGQYTVEIYFSQMFVASVAFDIPEVIAEQ